MAHYLSMLARIYRGDFKDASEEEKGRVVGDLVDVCSAAAGAAALDVLPIVDLALIHGIQLAMVEGIGRVHGYALDRRTFMALFKALRAGFFTRQLITVATNLLPGLGAIASASVAFAYTAALGEMCDFYFRTGRSASGEVLRSLFERTYVRARAGR